MKPSKKVIVSIYDLKHELQEGDADLINDATYSDGRSFALGTQFLSAADIANYAAGKLKAETENYNELRELTAEERLACCRLEALMKAQDIDKVCGD